jgi:xanthine dehydrogenase YagR molybdenum-binding subunit
MPANDSVIGKPLSRVDGRLKVTGGARYAAEVQIPGVTYGVLVLSTIASGRILKMETAAAEKSPGVLGVITHKNAPRVVLPASARALVDPEVGEPLQPLQSDLIHYHGQPIAVVVADTFERATHAAALVRATYREKKAIVDFAQAAAGASAPTTPRTGSTEPKKPPVYSRGDAEKALAAAPVQVAATYVQPSEQHNAMELHATVAVWEGKKLTLYDKTQWIDNVQKQVAAAFGLSQEDIRVVSPFVGGAFGAALRAWPHVFITALAAKQVGKPVKLMLTRAQLYTVVGYRPHNMQTISAAAERTGKLTALKHEAVGQTSTYEEFTESVLNPTRFLYACPNVHTSYKLARFNVNTPASMRGPGEATGVFALECILDELAFELNIDPLELRLRNHADQDPEKNLPWSSKSLKECYHQAAEKFGWSKRSPQPRATRKGSLLIGWGMATATWPAHRQPATVAVRIQADGRATVCTAASDIGPGTYTSMTQVAADALGLPVDRVQFQLGDSRLPPSPVEGGSMLMASVGTAVHEACLAARQGIFALARGNKNSPLHDATEDQITASDGRLTLRDQPDRGETYAEILKRNGKNHLEVVKQSKLGDESKKYSTRAFGAHFVEVHVDADFGTVRVARVVSGFAAGKIINPKTAHSQAIGGITGGIGMALLEEMVRDSRNGRMVNANLADYLVPVNADIPDLDAFYVHEEDSHVNPLGVKGIAELSLVGVAPAIANAVFHATGKRIRELPITPEKLLGAAT